MTDRIASGVKGLDDALVGLLPGDNVIVENAVGAPPNALLEALAAGALKRGEDVFYISFDASARAMQQRLGALPGVALVDCFSHGRQRGHASSASRADHDVIVVRDPQYPSEFMLALQGLPRKGPRRMIIVESLNGMAMLWGDERRVAEFYATVCPALFDAGDLAVWVLHEGIQTPQFHAQIGHIAQVVVRLGREAQQTYLTVERAVGRPQAQVGERFAYNGAEGFQLRKRRAQA